MLDNVSVGDWVGIVSLVLSIPMGVLSIFVYGWIRASLEKRKLIKTDQTRLQAIRAYNQIKSFHNRERDRYAYYLIVVGWAGIFTVASSTMIILIFVLHPDINFVKLDPPLPTEVGGVILLALAIVFATVAVGFMISIYSVAKRLEHFDDYKKEVEDRWGPIDVDDASK